jgi:nicotinate-nucleotide adenylyltransferase
LIRVAALCEAARAARRLGILGGSFDPPHAGHLHAARAARAAFDLDHVVLVPAARPPHKPERILAAGADRLAMAELLGAGEPWLSASAVEIERAGPSYSIDTVRGFRAETAAALFWILGSDNLLGLVGWRSAAELLRLCRPIVIQRAAGPVELEDVFADADLARLGPELVLRLRAGLCAAPPVEASSSELRARLAAGLDPGATLPAAVREYIAAHGIYRPR